MRENRQETKINEANKQGDGRVKQDALCYDITL